jgi:hypothetical protein
LEGNLISQREMQRLAFERHAPVLNTVVRETRRLLRTLVE